MKLNVVNHSTNRDKLQREAVSNTNLSFRTIVNLLAYFKSLWSEDVSFLAICVADKSDVSCSVRIVLDSDYFSRDSIFTVSLENESLPKGLFAVEVQLTFAATGEVADLQKFAANHSAGLEDYSTALKSECTPEIIKKQESTSKFYYTGDGSSSSVFCKLLEFEKITDELIAAGAVAESDNEMLTIRLIIDNR